MDVVEVDSKTFQLEEDELHVRPPIIEQLLHLLSPLLNGFQRVIWPYIQIGAGKVEDIRRLNNGHFDDPQVIIAVYQPRDSAAANLGYFVVVQPQIRFLFSLVESFPIVYLNGSLAVG